MGFRNNSCNSCKMKRKAFVFKMSSVLIYLLININGALGTTPSHSTSATTKEHPVAQPNNATSTVMTSGMTTTTTTTATKKDEATTTIAITTTAADTTTSAAPPPTTTEAPTTEAPTAEAPTTEAPTTSAPTTSAPTTSAPTTLAQTTSAPTTSAAPTSASISSTATINTGKPTDAPPVTSNQTTTEVTATTTEATSTTEATTTEAPGNVSLTSSTTLLSTPDSTSPENTTTSSLSTGTSGEETTITTIPDTTKTTSVPPSTTSTQSLSTTVSPAMETTAGGEKTQSTQQTTQQTTPDPCQSTPCVNGTCDSSSGTPICQCIPGFTGISCETDIKECTSDLCKNGGTCVDGVNNFTCKCQAGFNGSDCSTNIDDCISHPCANGATCKDGNNTFICQCLPGYTGKNCSIDIDDCASGPCENGATCKDEVNNYTCTCITGFNGTNCENDIDDCVGEKCSNGGTCLDGINNFTCTCTTGWTGQSCNENINECKTNTHDCDRNAICTDFDGGFNCSCWEGFTGDGKEGHCKDINECHNSTRCLNNATCVNTPGSYICLCKPGWTGIHCSQNINECNLPSSCAANATCTDSLGSFSCKCRDGYRGDGFHKCIQEVLVDINTVNQHRTGDDESFGPYPIDRGFWYFGTFYNTFYVSINGYITLGYYINETYPPRQSSSWTRFKFPVIAPLWADIETRNPSGSVNISYNLSEDDLKKIGNAIKHNVIPSNAIVVTWKNAVPYPYQQNANFQAADFQVIVSAAGSQTYVIFNYDQEKFTWKPSDDKFVAIGYTGSDKLGDIRFGSADFTSANNDSFGSAIKGRWIFNVTSNSTDWTEKSACLAAAENVTATIASIQEKPDPCPCSYMQASRDMRYRYEKVTSIGGKNASRFTPRFSRHSYSQKCHYSESGSLLKGFPGGGYLDLGTVNGMNLYDLCCTKSKICNMFYKANPSDTCSSYVPPTWSLSWGDPHVTTLDGRNFTFNGRGEYTLLMLNKTSSEAVKVQVRTAHVNDSESATAFVGIAAQEGNKTKVEVLLNTAKQASIYINGIFNTIFHDSQDLNVAFNGVHISSNKSTLIVVFESGLVIRIGVTDILDIVTSVPQDGLFKGKTFGLLGNNNEIDSDDFIMKNGTVLDANSNEEDLYRFGSSWMISESESLFGYHESGKNFSYFNNVSLAKPNIFIGDIENTTSSIIENCDGSTNLNVSHCNGNKACIVDTIGTCSKTFGERSKDKEKKELENKAEIEHMPPNLTIPDPLYVGYSFNTSVTIEFNEVFDIKCVTNINSHVCNGTYFFWNVSRSLRNSTVRLTITATDEIVVTSEYRPKIYYCGCEQKDQCDFSFVVEDGPVSGSENFYRARCTCSDEWEGVYCEEHINVCDRNPCYENVSCNGTSTPERPCGQCPDGLTGDGVKCYDVDECYTDMGGCDQECINTIGSYKCSCRDGFHLDGRGCKDIDECRGNASICDTKTNSYCNNTVGGYECLCRPGYTNESGNCVNVKEMFSYGGILVFRSPLTVSTEELEKYIRRYLTGIYNITGNVYLVEIVALQQTTNARVKREISSYEKYETDYIVHMKSQSPKTLQEMLDESFNKLAADDGYVSPNISQMDLNPNIVIFVSTEASIVFQDNNGGICNVPGATTCDLISTNCMSANGSYSCHCKEGFNLWANPYTSCKDIDECANSDPVCDGGHCENFPGSYRCNCKAGFMYDGTQTCIDMCDSSPCQNGGECIHGEAEGAYLCKCDDKWTGPNCADKNAEAEKLKTIAIAVGASVGGVCLLLVCAIFGLYRRHRNRYLGYRRRPLSSMEFDSSFGLAGSNIRTKDFPMDDDTDTAFSLPRPKVIQNEYETKENGGASSEMYDTYDAEKMDEPKKPLSRPTKDTSENGQDNPSFLHSQELESARRTSKRQSKNAYDYF